MGKDHILLKDMRVLLRCLDTPLDYEGWTNDEGEITKWSPANHPPVASCSVHATEGSNWRLYFESSSRLPKAFNRILVDLRGVANQHIQLLLDQHTYLVLHEEHKSDNATQQFAETRSWETTAPPAPSSSVAQCIDIEDLLNNGKGEPLCQSEPFQLPCDYWKATWGFGGAPSAAPQQHGVVRAQKRSAMDALATVCDSLAQNSMRPAKRRRIETNGNGEGEEEDEDDNDDEEGEVEVKEEDVI